MVEKMTFSELCDFFGKVNSEAHEQQKNAEYIEAVIVFKQGDYFKQEYTEVERSYKITNDCKYFKWWMCGSGLFGNCLDGTDLGVRLDHYIKECGWEIDYCYLL